jgi:hypothetical protein
VVVVCFLCKEKNNNNTQSSKNKFITLSFALRLRLERYHVREEFLAFNGNVAVQERLREPRYAWCTLYCVDGTVAVHERLREPLRQSEAAVVRGWYITRYSICVAWRHLL